MGTKPRIIFAGDSWTKLWLCRLRHDNYELALPNNSTLYELRGDCHFVYGYLFRDLGFECIDLGVPAGSNIDTLHKLSSNTELFSDNTHVVIFQTEPIRNHNMPHGCHDEFCNGKDSKSYTGHECFLGSNLTKDQFITLSKRYKRSFYDELMAVANQFPNTQFWLIGGCSSVNEEEFALSKTQHCNNNVKVAIRCVFEFLCEYSNKYMNANIKYNYHNRYDLIIYGTFHHILDDLSADLIDFIHEQKVIFWDNENYDNIRNDYFIPDGAHPNYYAAYNIATRILEHIATDSEMVAYLNKTNHAWPRVG